MRRLSWLTLILAACSQKPSSPIDTAARALAPQPPAPLTLPAGAIVTAPAKLGYLPGTSAVRPTGDFAYEIPIEVPAGRAGMQPELALAYDSSAGNGLAGVGFALDGAGSRIHRCRRTLAAGGTNDGVDFDAGDAFCLDGAPLVEIAPFGPDAYEYRTEQDRIARIVGFGPRGHATHWRAWLKNGRVRTYATTVPAQRVLADAQGLTPLGQVDLLWLLSNEDDRDGNRITHAWQATAGQAPPYAVEVRPVEIAYTAKADGSKAAMRHVTLEYEPRPDAIVENVSGVRLVTTQRLKTIALHAPNPVTTEMVWKYELEYQPSAGSGRSLLSSVRRCGALAGCTWKKVILWEHNLRPAFESATVTYEQHKPESLIVLDADGDGRDDLLYQSGDSAEVGPSFTLRRMGSSPLSAATGIGAEQGEPFFGLELSSGRPFDATGDGKASVVAYVHGIGQVSSRKLRAFAFDPAQLTFVPGAVYQSVPYGHQADAEWVDLDGDGILEEIYAEDDGLVVHWWVHRWAQGSVPVDTGLVANVNCRARGGDFDNDGRGELLVLGPGPSGPCTVAKQIGFDDAGAIEIRDAESAFMFPADLDGDGLPESLQLGGFSPVVRWNTGNGLGPAVPFDDDFIQWGLPQISGTERQFLATDLDGDGRDDLLFFRRDALRGVYGLLSKGDGSFQWITTNLDPRDTASLGDFDGDGLIDVLLADDHHLEVLVQKPGEVDVIEEVRDEVEALRPRARIGWERERVPTGAVCTYPSKCLRAGVRVVRWVSGSDFPTTRHYSYEDPRLDLVGRGFLGFGVVREWEAARPVETTTLYDHAERAGTVYPGALRPFRVTKVVPVLDDAGLAAKPASALARVEEVTFYNQLHWLNGGKSFFVVASQENVREWEEPVSIDWTTMKHQHITGVDGPSGSPMRDRQTWRAFDDFLNLTHEETNRAAQIDGAISLGDEEILEQGFDNRLDGWLVGLMTSVSEYKAKKNANPKPAARQRTMTYDGRGHLELLAIEPGSLDPSVRQDVVVTVDGDGLVRSMIAQAPGVSAREQHHDYDAEGVFETVEWNALGIGRFFVHHPAYGVPVVTMDANGRKTTVRWDELGRPAAIARDGGAETVISYAPDMGGVVVLGMVEHHQSGTGEEQKITRDELGREVRRERRGFDGQWVVESIARDTYGRVVSKSRPGAGQPGPASTMRYDSLDRLLSTLHPDGTTSTESHPSWNRQLHTDAAGDQRLLEMDANGRVASTVVYTGANAIETSYFWGAFDQLDEVIDAEGHVTQHGYDARGRRISLADPDTGLTTFGYDGHGELASVVDALGQTKLIRRDAAGRVVRTDDADGRTFFVWDSAPHGIGRIASTESPDGTLEHRAYDAYGRLERTTTTVAGESFEIELAYDPLGRVERIRYPEVPGRTRFEVGRSFTMYGALEQLFDAASGAPIFTVKSRDASDQLLEAISGNGVVTTRSYDKASGRLLTSHASMQGTIFDLAFEYFADGNLKRRVDGVAGRVESFTYDRADRLKTWSVTAGMETRETTYEYDDIGNLTGTLLGGGVVDTNTYGFNAGPHALTGSRYGTYVYDARGRQTQHVAASGPGRSIAYTAFDLPRRVDSGALHEDLSYDAFGKRSRKLSSSGDETVYVSDLYERRTEGGVARHVFRVRAPDGEVAQIIRGADEKDDAIRYLHGDQLGTVSVVTDQDGAELERRFVEPFGRPVEVHGAAIAEKVSDVRTGFTGHRQDGELELVDMMGRIYDPTIRRFLTPDPFVVSPLDGQSYNHYSYVRNNPLFFTDPTGYAEKEGHCEQKAPGVVQCEGASVEGATAAPVPAPSMEGPGVGRDGAGAASAAESPARKEAAQAHEAAHANDQGGGQPANQGSVEQTGGASIATPNGFSNPGASDSAGERTMGTARGGDPRKSFDRQNHARAVKVVEGWHDRGLVDENSTVRYPTEMQMLGVQSVIHAVPTVLIVDELTLQRVLDAYGSDTTVYAPEEKVILVSENQAIWEHAMETVSALPVLYPTFVSGGSAFWSQPGKVNRPIF